MKKILSIILFSIFCSGAQAQQWAWAVAADSVTADQALRALSNNNTHLYALICQNGPSYIQGAYTDSGCVVVKVSVGGQIEWVRALQGDIQCVYAANNGSVYFSGRFTGTIQIDSYHLTSAGSSDIVYGELDAQGNALWVKSAGGIGDDNGNAIITNAGALYVGGTIAGDFHVGASSFTGYTGINTYLLRCDLAGNCLQSYGDSAADQHIGLNFQADAGGTIYILTQHDLYSTCTYYCWEYLILKIDPLLYTPVVIAAFDMYEHVHSWLVNDDLSITPDFSTGSHYTNTYDLFWFDSSGNFHRAYRKGMGDEYDGKATPCIVKGIQAEIVTGGSYDKGWQFGRDTLWYDSFKVVPDSMPRAVVAAIDTLNQYTWMLSSGGRSMTHIAALCSDRMGNYYVGGDYNNPNWKYPPDQTPRPVAFGNTVLPAQNTFQRFYIAGISSVQKTAVPQQALTQACFYPNPSNGRLYWRGEVNVLKVYNLYGEEVNAEVYNGYIDLQGCLPGVYFVDYETRGGHMFQKIIIK